MVWKPTLTSLPLTLSPYSRNGLSKEVFVGYAKTSPKFKVYISGDDLAKHAVIVGSTGSGKTTTAAHIATQASKQGRTLILDWFGEYQNLLRRGKVFKPCRESPIPLLVDDVVDLINIFEEVLQLTPAQSYIMLKALDGVIPANLSVLEDVIEGFEVEARWMLESKLALLRRLQDLSRGRNYISRDSKLVETISKSEEPVIVDLSQLKDFNVKKLSVLLTLKAVEVSKMKHLLNDQVYVFVEEAHNVVNSNTDLVGRLMSEVRKLGIAIVLVTQSPLILNYRMLNNANVKVVHTLKSREDIELIVKSLGLSEDLRAVIPKLGVGEAIVDAPGQEPVIVEVKPSL
ncbi:MAG: hypothetical protein B7O98_01395 [Zestosphaera tikiterensis]|uniref:Helicase HerA central domain-containing protein n=1 Tax=Zestosphaera tikiterensis TaxID=1973259 RepID=A0A2R7Y6G1_9CREN|nr:MAG: hypothetical protein B7O98_01395 [Zestosphaera tikiterensis]